jgi:hypothetical protein
VLLAIKSMGGESAEATGGEPVVNKVYRPGLVDLTCIRSILAQLGFHATLRRFVARKIRVLTIVDTFGCFSSAVDPRFSYREKMSC